MNVLIIGLGSIAKKHISALNSLNEQFNIYALRSGINADHQEGIINIFDIGQLLVPIDFAIISNPTNLHYEFIDRLIEERIPLFIEKPPLSTLKGAYDLAYRIEQSAVKTYVACNLRFHPCIKYIKEFVLGNADRRINEVNVYCGSYLPEWRPGQDFRKIYSANAEMGGGVHLDLFHELDYTQWIFGVPSYVHCFRHGNSTLNINASDYANYVLGYNDFTASIILNYYRKDSKRNIEILFEDETWAIDLIRNTITGTEGNDIYNAGDFEMTDTYRSQMQYFIKCLTDNQTPMNTFTESLETLKTCLCNE
jgi:predicted dehydrogenase